MQFPEQNQRAGPGTSADQIENQESRFAHHRFHDRPEKKQDEHVHQDVHDSGMQELKRNKSPDLPVIDGLIKRKRAPLRQVASRKQIQKKDADIQNEKPARDRAVANPARWRHIRLVIQNVRRVWRTGHRGRLYAKFNCETRDESKTAIYW